VHPYATHPLGDLKIRPRHGPRRRAADFRRLSRAHLLTAESSGRRETLLDQLRGCAIRPAVVRSWAEFMAAGDPVC
jgi:hypothetical protein